MDGALMTKDDQEFMQKARARAKRGRDALDENYRLMDDDIDFLHGNQWDEEDKQLRATDGRPTLTFNKLPSIGDIIVGEQRKMRPSIHVRPAQGDIRRAVQKISNLTGKKDYTLSEVYEGIIRNIEYTSSADMAYDTAFEHGSHWGLGWMRVLSEYSDDISSHFTKEQELRIKRIRNYKSVVCDPDFTEPDGSDMQWAMVFYSMSDDAFDEKWPGKSHTSADIDADQKPMWADGKNVYIAEYYYLKKVSVELCLMSDGQVFEYEKVKPVLDELATQGLTVQDQKTVEMNRCYWSKISGADILEPEQPTVFRYVPVVPVFGKELVVDGTPYYRGFVRHAKDAQRMYNYHRTSFTERTGVVTKIPFIIADKQLKDHENDWGDARTYHHVDGVPPPHRETAISEDVQGGMLAADDVKGTTGMFDPSMGMLSGASSGEQEKVLQSRGDAGNFPFADNLVRSIRHLGRIIIEAIPEIYDTQRIVRLHFPDEKEDFIEINKTVTDTQTGKEFTINDLSVAKFDLVVRPGPTFQTQRQEASEMIGQFIRAVGSGGDPVTAKALAMLYASNSDFPGADEIVDILRKSLPQGLVEEDPDEEPRKQPPPTPGQQADMAKAQADIAQAEAKKKDAEARMAKAEADMLEISERLQNLDANIADQVATAVAGALQQLFGGQQQNQ